MYCSAGVSVKASKYGRFRSAHSSPPPDKREQGGKCFFFIREENLFSSAVGQGDNSFSNESLRHSLLFLIDLIHIVPILLCVYAP